MASRHGVLVRFTGFIILISAVGVKACSDPLGMESGDIPDESITASSTHSPGLEPYLGRLNGVAGGGGWVAKYLAIGQWLQVDLGEMKRVMGTIIQGRPSTDQRVTSYKLQYSTDRITWTTYAGSNGSEMVFPGNFDRSTPVPNLLNNPVDARYVRFVVQSWLGTIAMRAEIVGCNTTAVLPPACPHMLGMESGAIPDSSITASSFLDPSHEPYRGRLNGFAGAGAWVPKYNIIGQWFQPSVGRCSGEVPASVVDLREFKIVAQTSLNLGAVTRERWPSC
ncbi:retinoschisin-like [Branchiostoma lanceolatum]|uniref:retinoschisin-like n=1 Tax=Branchiostoma lanceolatum TaxID=7740 RepID=UPI0034532C10